MTKVRNSFNGSGAWGGFGPDGELIVKSGAILRGDDGLQVRSYAGAGSAYLGIRPVSVGFSTFGTATHRQIYQIPFSGPVAVRARYETDNATAVTIGNTSFAAGRAFSDTNPLDASGNAATWTVVSNTTLTNASATYSTDGKFGMGRTAWIQLYAPAATDGIGSYIYVNTKMATSTASCMVGNASRPISDWANTVNGLLPNLKYTSFFSSGDYCTTAQGTMPTTSPSFYAPVAQLDVLPAGQAFWGVAIGDSTVASIGTGTPATQPMNYSWYHVASNLRNSAGVKMAISNYGYEGKPNAFYLGSPGSAAGVLAQLLADTDFYPSFVIIQPASRNDTNYQQSLIDEGMRTALWCASECKKHGIVPIFRTCNPSSALSGAEDAVRVAFNNFIRQNMDYVLDLDLIVSSGTGSPIAYKSGYSFDGAHMTKIANDAVGAALAALLARIGF